MSDYYQNKFRIDSNRLRGWDYRNPGWYFVTICTYDGICYFGNIQDEIMGLSEIGCIVWKYWYEIPEHPPHARLGECIVMPNHVHMTIRLSKPKPGLAKDSEARVETFHETSLPQNTLSGRDHINRDTKNKFMSSISPKPGSLSVIIRLFKGAIRTWCKENDRGNFAWQPGFHDHIVRNPRSLHRINTYIRTNPERWEEDRYHPDNWSG